MFGSLLVGTLKRFKSDENTTNVSGEIRHEIYEKSEGGAAHTLNQMMEKRKIVEDEHRSVLYVEDPSC